MPGPGHTEHGGVPAGPSYTPEVAQRNMARNVSGKASQEAVAPYQALPVQGPVITQHLTPAQDVVEPGAATEEVGVNSGSGACLPRRRHARRLPPQLWRHCCRGVPP